MPIKIPNDLPAFEKLQQEGVRLIAENEALRQDVRPMQVALLNLMPEKPKTETQLARLLGATPLQVELTLLTTSTYRPNTVPLSHLQTFYRTWEDVSDRKFDGLIITGAPVEMLPFEDVKYWPELTRILDWSRTNVHARSTSAGVPRRPSTISTACPSIRCRQALRRIHAPSQRAPGSAAAGADARLRRLFPGAGLAPHRGPCRRPAEQGRPRGAGGLRHGRPVPRAGARASARSTCSTTSSTTPTPSTTNTAATGPRVPTSRCRTTTIPAMTHRSAAQLLARIRTSAVRQLDQRNVPDHAL